jgi:hypothetical protein
VRTSVHVFAQRSARGFSAPTTPISCPLPSGLGEQVYCFLVIRMIPVPQSAAVEKCVTIWKGVLKREDRPHLGGERASRASMCLWLLRRARRPMGRPRMRLRACHHQAPLPLPRPQCGRFAPQITASASARLQYLSLSLSLPSCSHLPHHPPSEGGGWRPRPRGRPSRAGPTPTCPPALEAAPRMKRQTREPRSRVSTSGETRHASLVTEAPLPPPSP